FGCRKDREATQTRTRAAGAGTTAGPLLLAVGAMSRPPAAPERYARDAQDPRRRQHYPHAERPAELAPSRPASSQNTSVPSLTIDTTVDIDASRDAVWDVVTDFASYSEWNPSMRIEGTPEVGTKLVVHLLADGGHGMSFKAKVLAATPGEELRWL